MKRFGTILAVMTLVAVLGASASAEGLMLGVKGGLNFASDMGGGISAAYEDVAGLTLKSKARLAYGGGLFANYPLTESLSLQAEFLLMMKGPKGDVKSGVVKYTLYQKLTYLEIPLLVKYRHPPRGRFGPYLIAGPYLGILTGAKWKEELEIWGDLYAEDQVDVKDVYDSIDIGALFGFGVDYMMGKSRISFEMRYEYSFFNALDTPDDIPEGFSYNSQNAGLVFMLGYGIEL